MHASQLKIPFAKSPHTTRWQNSQN